MVAPKRLMRGPSRYGPGAEHRKPGLVIRLVQFLMITAFVIMVANASSWASSSRQASAAASVHVDPVPAAATSVHINPLPEIPSATVQGTVQPVSRPKGAASLPLNTKLFNVEPLVRVYPDPFASFESCTPEDIPASEKKRLDYSLSWEEDFPSNCEGHEDLCDVLKGTAINREVMVAVANSHAPGLAGFLDSIKRLAIKNFMVVAIDKKLADQLKRQGVPYYYSENKAQGNHGVSAQKFGILKEFIHVGCSVLLTDTDVVYLKNPFPYLYRDADIEGMSDGWDNKTVHGMLDPIDDPSLGVDSPARHRHSFRLAAMNSGLWYVHATRPAGRLMAIMQHRLATEDLWDQTGYNMELMYPSRDKYMNAGATVRVASPFCFVNSKVMFRVMRFDDHMMANHVPVAMHANYHVDKPRKMALVDDYYVKGRKSALSECPESGTGSDGCQRGTQTAAELESMHLHNINDGIINSAEFRHADFDSAQGEHACKPMLPWNGQFDGMTHTLNLLPDGGGVSIDCESDGRVGEFTDLCHALKSNSNSESEVVLVVGSSESASKESISLFSGSLSNSDIKNVLFVAVDEDFQELVPQALMFGPLPASWHRAAVKWHIAEAALQMGFKLLLTEVDTVFFRNPFSVLYRDSDIEVGTDGWDDLTSYGLDHVVDDPKMGWSRFVHGTRVFTRDPGLIYMQPTEETLRLSKRMTSRLLGLIPTPDEAEGEKQERIIFNEEVFLPSHGTYLSPGVVVRVMSYLCYPNSKGFLRFYSRMHQINKDTYNPVSLRLSYHKNRMCADGIHNRLKEAGWKAGVLMVPKIETVCAANTKILTVETCKQMQELGTPTGELTEHVIEKSKMKYPNKKRGAWAWGGVTKMLFAEDGKMESPWGPGIWGTIKGSDNSLWAEFVGTLHLLTFESAGDGHWNMFISHRCTDSNVVVGRHTMVDDK